MQPVLSEIPLSPGNYFSIGGTATASGRAELELALHAALAMAAIVGLLVIAINSHDTVVIRVPLYGFFPRQADRVGGYRSGLLQR
jgi:hypothetical protein